MNRARKPKPAGQDSLAEAAFLFDPDSISRPDEPTNDATRLAWLLLSLIRRRVVSYQAYYAHFRCADRTFARDVKKLRRLGETFGFRLTRQQKGTVRLAHLDGEHKPTRKAEAGVADSLNAVADALGEVIAADLRGVVQFEGSPADRFLHVAAPRLVEQTAVAKTYSFLRDAWASRARAAFHYPGRSGGPARERTVEPYRVSYNAGRYYLIAFDVHPRNGGWRQFALDRVTGDLRRAGTFTARPVPAEYRGEDAVGLFKTATRPIEVTIALSPVIAGAVTARRWQAHQRVQLHSDGTADITFDVYDLGEAVRWALGFGPEARILAPAGAVALARDSARSVLEQYEPEPAALQTA